MIHYHSWPKTKTFTKCKRIMLKHSYHLEMIRFWGANWTKIIVLRVHIAVITTHTTLIQTQIKKCLIKTHTTPIQTQIKKYFTNYRPGGLHPVNSLIVVRVNSALVILKTNIHVMIHWGTKRTVVVHYKKGKNSC